MENVLRLMLVLLVIAALAAFAGGIAWLVSDARQRGRSGGLNAVLFFLLGPVVAVAAHSASRGRKLIDLQPGDYTQPDEALKAAAMLESLGEWDAAIALLQSIASRWPEHQGYVQRCIQAIEHKQSVAS